jgi:DNA-binding response OmpR family regulator
MIILIVEDEPKVQQLLRGHFEQQGHQMFGTGTGEEAIRLLRAHQPDLMLLDLWLKGKVDGIGVLKEAKVISPKTKIIVATGFEEAAGEQLEKLGASALLKKPIRLEELDALLQQVQAGSGTAT